jgi:hypothetical protein
MAAPDFQHHPGEPLRLVRQAEPCSVRSMAIDALKAAGIAWTEVFVGGGGADHRCGRLRGSRRRGAQPSCRTARNARCRLAVRTAVLPSRHVVLHSNVTDPRTKNSPKTLATTIRATANFKVKSLDNLRYRTAINMHRRMFAGK